MAALAFAQGVPAPKKLSFDVASVKHNETVSRTSSGRFGPDSFTATNITLRGLLLNAYGIRFTQIDGGPTWLNTDRYDVSAKADKPTDKAQLKIMLQSLLADRFRMAVHHETRQVPAWELTVAKGGPKIYPVGDPKNRSLATSPHARRMQMSTLALMVDKLLNMPVSVTDNTGLKGEYDVILQFPEEPESDPIMNFQRMLEPLGLKLESRGKAPADFLVIDRASKPTAN